MYTFKQKREGINRMKKASFLLISMVLLTWAAPSTGHAALRENFSQFDNKSGIPTDPLIVQCSIAKPLSAADAAAARSSQLNLYEGHVQVQHTVDKWTEVVDPGCSVNSNSCGIHLLRENEMLKLCPPSKDLYQVTVVVSEGWVQLRTPYGEGRLDAATTATDTKNNTAVIGYKAISQCMFSHPEILLISQSTNVTLADAVKANPNIGFEMAQANANRTISNNSEVGTLAYNDNSSGLGDGTNPGNGAGTGNSPNQGTNNPNQSNS